MSKPKYRRNMRMKGVRIENGNLSQLKAAALMGFTAQYYSRVERGMIDGSVEFWRTFADVFHLSDAIAWQIMTNKTGSNIFANIKTSKRDDYDKLAAIRIVAKMETINGITKAELRDVIKFLLRHIVGDNSEV